MHKGNFSRFKITGWIFIALIIAIVVFFVYLPGYTRIKRLRIENERINRNIADLKQEISRIKSDMKRLETDPSIWERLARKNVGAVKEGEILVDIQHKTE